MYTLFQLSQTLLPHAAALVVHVHSAQQKAPCDLVTQTTSRLSGPYPHPQSKPKLTAVGVPESSIYEVDLARAAASPEVFAAAFKGCDALVVATSAVPVLQPLSLIRVFWAKFTGGERVMPSFSWKEGQSPEQVGWAKGARRVGRTGGGAMEWDQEPWTDRRVRQGW